MTAAALDAEIGSARQKWPALLWIALLTALWIALTYSFPVITASGAPSATARRTRSPKARVRKPVMSRHPTAIERGKIRPMPEFTIRNGVIGWGYEPSPGTVTRRSVRLIRPPSGNNVEVPGMIRSTP